MLVISLAKDGESSLSEDPYATVPQILIEHGHRAASFDLPHHGQRTDQHGEELIGLRNAYLAGADPFKTCVQDARELVDHCIRRGLTRAGRILVAGTSRGGYMALRILAADERVAAAAVMAPVTDWGHLTEFSDAARSGKTEALRLIQDAEAMAGRHVYLAIGNNDDRVSTASCADFFDQLTAVNIKHKGLPASVILRITNDAGHHLPAARHREAARFLLAVTK